MGQFKRGKRKSRKGIANGYSYFSSEFFNAPLKDPRHMEIVLAEMWTGLVGLNSNTIRRRR
jgi:hypothetical protein